MPKKATNGGGTVKVIRSQADMDKAVKAINNILRRDKAKGARLYVPELTWMFFLRYLDLMEEAEAQKAAALGAAFTASLNAPYRWRDWAAPFDHKKPAAELKATQSPGWRRAELTGEGSTLGDYLKFVNAELFSHLQKLGEDGNATDKQKIIAEIFRNKERTVLASETNLQDALDRVHALSQAQVSEQHMFPMSQALESLLPSLGEKKNDGGQFFTPREIIRVIVKTVNPRLGRTVYDPCAGTCGFLIEAFKHLMKQQPTGTQIQQLKTEILWARDDAAEAIPIALANMVLHGVDLPRIWHGNTLTRAETYGELFAGAPTQP
jgi:type I restriction enzyme M protein